ncbi:MAG: PD-(D/E)XK nuclease family transposase [Polyangiaceae bacterium]
MREVFADPKMDVVFQRIFGAEEHEGLLIALLNVLLSLDDAHRIVEVEILPPEHRPKIPELKYSIVDVRCIDAHGTHYVVKVQALYVEHFEKRVVEHVARDYVIQLGMGEPFPGPNGPARRDPGQDRTGDRGAQAGARRRDRGGTRRRDRGDEEDSESDHTQTEERACPAAAGAKSERGETARSPLHLCQGEQSSRVSLALPTPLDCSTQPSTAPFPSGEP